MPLRVGGLDPSLSSFGAAVACGPDVSPLLYRLKPKPRQVGHERLDFLLTGVAELVEGCDMVVIEGVLAGMLGAETHMNLIGLHHLLRHLLWGMGIPYAVVSAKTRAKYITGNGSAEKDECLLAAVRRFPMADVAGNDQADALTLAAMGSEYYGQPLVTMPQDRTALLRAKRTDLKHKGQPVIVWPLLDMKGVLSA
jgi:crossover junction endodeoxyribonuclease RuvC